MNEQQRAALKALRSNRTNTIYSDLTLRCNGVDFSLHRVIVCPQSRRIYQAQTASRTGVIDESLFSAATVGRVILFLYDQCYRWQTDQLSASPTAAEVFQLLLMQIDVHTAAVHFEIDALVACCEQDFSATLPMIRSSGGDCSLLVNLAELIYRIPTREAARLWQAVVFAFVYGFGQAPWRNVDWRDNEQRVAFMRDIDAVHWSMQNPFLPAVGRGA